MIKNPVVSLALAACLVAAPILAQQPATPAFAVYQLPEAKRVKLPNGLVLLLLERHDLPLTAVSMELRSGSLQDPAGKPGVSSITEELLRKGTETKIRRAARL